MFLVDAERQQLIGECQRRYDDPRGNIEWVEGELPDSVELYYTEVDGVCIYFTVDEGVNLDTDTVCNIVDSVSVMY